MTPTDEQRAKFEAQKREVVAAAIFGNPKPRDGSALPFADQPALIRKSFLDSADLVIAALAAQEGGGGEHDGYKEAAIAWAVCASIHREYAKGRDPLYTTRQADYMKAHEAARTKAMRATQEGTGNG